MGAVHRSLPDRLRHQHGAEMTIFQTIVLIMVLVALVFSVYFRHLSRGSSMHDGVVEYQDTERNRLFAPLVSHTYLLTGQPDYLVRTKEGLIPLEVKSRACGTLGPYAGEVAQLVMYCLLVEDVFGETVSYGILQFADRDVKVQFSPNRRNRLLELLRQIRVADASASISRNHKQASRCRACGFREVCDQSLDAVRG